MLTTYKGSKFHIVIIKAVKKYLKGNFFVILFDGHYNFGYICIKKTKPKI